MMAWPVVEFNDTHTRARLLGRPVCALPSAVLEAIVFAHAQLRIAGMMVGTVMLLALFAGLAGAATWTVEQDGTGDYTDISSAISAASTGDIVMVGPGMYEGVHEIGVAPLTDSRALRPG